MVLFKLSCLLTRIKGLLIYIPLWSYSNQLHQSSHSLQKKFTFHYGPIQILVVNGKTVKANVFTFHYGPIQIWLVACPLYHLILFTFHYGPIQMVIKAVEEDENRHLHSTMVLFKY